MDGGFRTSPRPTERRVASRPEPTYRQAEEPVPVSEPPKPAVHHTTSSRGATKKEKKSFKRFLWPVIVVIVILVVTGGWFAWSNMNGGGAVAIDSNKYQAVFFSNGQVYFGKLQATKGDYMKLTDIFYLQAQQSAEEEEKDSTNPQETSTGQNNVQLIKLGDEIHGPEDEMIISKDQVLFYENLKADGKVAQSIQKFKNK
jgi:hypothetical protein